MKYLMPLEENELSRFLSRCCQIGYVRSKLALVQRILDSKGMKITLSHGWCDSFRSCVYPAPVSQV